MGVKGQRTMFVLGSYGKLVCDFLLVIIELFSLGAFVLSQSTRLTDRQMLIARCDLMKLDVHKNEFSAQADHVL